jgi:hypothetical protein
MAGIAILGSLHSKDARLASTPDRDETGSTPVRPWYDPERWTAKISRMWSHLERPVLVAAFVYGYLRGLPSELLKELLVIISR